MKESRVLRITAHRMCISTIRQCMYLLIYIVHIQGADQKYFWTWHNITCCSAIYIDSIFIIQDVIFLKNDCCDTFCDV